MDEEQEQYIQPEGQVVSYNEDALSRINTWLDRLEKQAHNLLAAFQPEELEPEQAATLAGKYILLIARLLELRQQFTTETTSEEERLLHLIFASDRSEIDKRLLR